MRATSNFSALDALTVGLATGEVRLVDLTAPLSSATPVLQLPPEMAPIPPFSLEELARYDERGRTSYRNGIHTAEHVEYWQRQHGVPAAQRKGQS